MSTANPENKPLHQAPTSSLRGEHLDNGTILELRKSLYIGPTEPLIEVPETRKRIDPVAFVKAFRAATHFKELDADLVVTEDPIGLMRVLQNGTQETYMEKMEAERKKGSNEAASYGRGKIGKNEFVGVLLNWEFMAATSGTIVSEKIKRAANLAIEEDKPLIIVSPSGGQRQQEAVPALDEMSRTVASLRKFKRQTTQPLILALVANTWGGFMASAVPMGDIVAGIAGSEAGFAGPPVIAAVEGKRPSAGSQSVEKIADTNRNVHVILKDHDEFIEYLKRTLDITNNAEKEPGKPKKLREMSGLDFDQAAIHIPWRPTRMLRNHRRASIPTYFDKIDPKTVWDQHQVLSSDPRRPDTLYLLQNTFDGFISFFSGRMEKDTQGRHLIYPAIVAALAYIDDPRLEKRITRMVIGNQPNYHELPTGVIKEHASPTAWDFRYQLRMMETAARWKTQITSFVDTFGASSRLRDDQEAQYQAIAQCLNAQLGFPLFETAFLTGVGGSGGSETTNFRGDHAVMLSGAQDFVSEPRAAASIIYRNPTKEDIIRTAEGMRPTAPFLLSIGLIDKIIEEPKGGAQNHPLETALLIREEIILADLAFGHLTSEQIMVRRDERIFGAMPIPIGRLNELPKDCLVPQKGVASRLRNWIDT